MERFVYSTRRGGTRKLLACITLVALAFAFAVPMLAGGAAGAAPSSDINDYALYAAQTLQLKGGGAGTQSIIDGNIGAGTRHWSVSYIPSSTGAGQGDEYGTYQGTQTGAFLKPLNNSAWPGLETLSNTGDVHVTLCQGSGTTGHLTLLNGGYVVAPSTNINQSGSGCNISSVYTLVQNNGIAPPAIFHKLTSASAPDIKEPAFPKITCGGTSASKYHGATLAPGTYDTWDFSGATTLSAGTYNFCKLTVEQYASLVTQPGTVINVQGAFYSLGGAGQVGACGTSFNIGGAVNFGRNGNYKGTFFAPNDDVALGNGTVITGHVWALAMHSDWGVSVGKCPPGGGTTTTSAPPTTPPTTAPPTTVAPTTVPPTTVPPTTVPPTTVPPTTVPPTTAPPTTAPPTTAPPTTAPPTTAPPTTLPGQ
jgi:hypothetical protein